MQLYCGYIAAMRGGCAGLRSEPCGKLENEILFSHMVTTRQPHGCLTTPARGPPMGRMWVHRFRLKTHPTHSTLTLASWWPHAALTQAAGEFFHFPGPIVRQLPHGSREGDVDFIKESHEHAVSMRIVCDLCEEREGDPQ